MITNNIPNLGVKLNYTHTIMKNSLLLVAFIAISISSVYCKNILSQDEGAKRCMARSGLTRSEIVSISARNENCAIDCVTRQGTIQTYYVDDNTPCHTIRGYRCLLGNCQGPEVRSVDNDDLFNTEIRVVSAHVPDMDPTPSKGHSDSFVVLKVKDSVPTYNDNEILCHTYTVVDDGNPMWQNFVCKPLPLKNKAKLTFLVLDSDKPLEIPDVIGQATESLEYLLNRGPTKLQLVGAGDDEDYHIMVDVRGEEYSPN